MRGLPQAASHQLRQEKSPEVLNLDIYLEILLILVFNLKYLCDIYCFSLHAAINVRDIEFPSKEEKIELFAQS